MSTVLLERGDAFVRGWNARMEGQSLESNSESRQALRDAWNRGWAEAAKQPNAPPIETK